MGKFIITYGLSGGFGGADNCKIIDEDTLDKASSYAYEEACGVYEDYSGLYGLRTLSEVLEELQEEYPEATEEDYLKYVKNEFIHGCEIDLLIVVDKLLTGFDEPKNAVLYIDKPLKEHNLIQAIARVNRLHDQKKFGLLIDYRGILAELDTTIADYQNLAAKTQGGYDINDIDGLYHQMSTEYKRLPRLHKSLWAIFENVKNKADIEQLRQVLVPRLEIREGESLCAFESA